MALRRIVRLFPWAGCKILAHLSKNPGHLSKISGSGPNLLVLFAENCCGGQTVAALPHLSLPPGGGSQLDEESGSPLNAD